MAKKKQASQSASLAAWEELDLTRAAADARVLSHLLHDLREAWGGSGAAAGEAETARVYGENGAWARDPRTEAPAARLKDVLEGRLDGFLEAWKRRARAGV